MLRLLSKAQTEVREQYGTPQLELDFHKGRDARLVVSETRQNIANELKISGAEAIGLLEVARIGG